MTKSLQTLAERTEFKQTGRTDEVEALAAELARIWPQAVRSFEYGRTTEGRTMRALVVSRSGALSPAELKQKGIPLLMIQGGIHPGESDGKDGGFIALRDLLQANEGSVKSGATAAASSAASKSTQAPHDVLQQIAILFVPAFNTDGHERVGRWNRPNQNGPEETGWRTTAQNINLNRDYTKADTPEMHAMLRLISEWDPLVCADLHVTDGADFEPDISIQVEPINQGDPSLRTSGVQLRDELIAKLATQDSLPLPFYPDLATTDDPSSGFILTVYSPRFSTGYFPQRNRFTVLVETHSWKDYAKRVRVMRNTVVDLAELVEKHGAKWLAVTREADLAASRLGGTSMTLDFASSWREPSKAGKASVEPDSAGARMIDFRGYAYTREPSAISGDRVTVYDPKRPQIWRVPLRDTVRPSVTVTAPKLGYIVPASFAAEIGPKLDLQGISYERRDEHQNKVRLQAFRATEVTYSSAPFEGRMRATLKGDWREEVRDVRAGSLFVPISQPLARLVVALLEPQAPDSFAAWGFFNACFEQKEQLEPYVAEQIAREMLAKDTNLKAEFDQKLKDDPPFAASPSDRLEFFLRRHSSWDERYNLYPVYRLN